MKRTILSALIIMLAVGAPGFSRPKPKPRPEETPQQIWFQNAKFGMFIHWGVYSVLGDGEWVMNQHKMTVAEYEKLAPKFNPTKFDAAAWVALAKSAGMKYITITSKHHDGFAVFATKQSKWNIVDATPYGKDPLKMLADECHKQGIKLFFYYSQLDWHNPDYFPLGMTGHTAGRPKGGDWNKYLDYMDAQLTELLTNYGPIGGIWFDGWWDKPKADWKLQRTYALIHRLQPQALVGSNHHQAPNPGEDFQMFEKDLPGHSTQDFNKDSVVGALPLEMAETMNNSWGYNKNDDHYKSVKQLIQLLVKAAGYNSNLLLNIGPKPDGTTQPQFVERLHAMGEWIQKNGESIYGTRGGPITPRPWGVTTQKGKTVYVHILDWQDPALLLPKLDRKIASAYLLSTGEKVKTIAADYGNVLKLPASAHDPIDNIVVLKMK